MAHTLKILGIKQITHDTNSYKIEKPEKYKFIPGQATELSINLPRYKTRKRPFTFASLNEEPYLEFIIKSYKERDGVTKKLLDVKEGDEFLIEEPFGAIQYKKSGIFIAGGAGITPFIAILRQLREEGKLKGNILIFSNKTEKDIILKKELESMKELKKIYTLTRESNKNYEHGRVNERFLKKYVKNFNQNFYVCGPVTMVGEITYILQKLGAKPDSIVVES